VDTVFKVALALAVGWLLWKVGTALLGSFVRPIPEPPPVGEMRRIKLRYRCSICGMELRIDRATEELPPPPRHCQDEMDLVAPVDE
jgi:hypothetical protein